MMSYEMDMAGDGKPSSAHLNQTTNFEDLKMDSNFLLLLCSLLFSMAWIIYIIYYNSRVMGYFITRLLNHFIADGYMQVGSFTSNALAGKIMFRDIVYITNDFTVRVQDGYLIFRWWRSYVPKDVSEDLSHSDTRLSVVLNGFELHVYNRTSLYANLEKVFGLDSQIFPKDDGCKTDAVDNNSGGENDDAVSPTVGNTRRMPHEAAALPNSWRDLIPVIKVDVTCGRVVFGNRLVPTTLSITVEEAHFVYSTKPAASRLDHFMHFTKCKAENFKVILAPSPKYTGMVDDPPRYMGEGFVVLSSNNIELYFYMDETGVVPEEPEMLQLANGDIVESAPPIWGMDIKCGKGTDFSYGPWADRQREHLFKFFFPADYQPLQVTKATMPGEKRKAQSFDICLSTLNEATVDILFSKNKETNAVHINVGAGSYLEVTMPWFIQQDGYTTKIIGQLLHLEATTSLQYWSLVLSGTLEFTIKCHYPINWNDHQEWILNLTGCKASVNLIDAHKCFFQDLINDWASKARPDLLHVVPYTWKITLMLKEFELITLSNEYNWIDCSSQNQENAHIAFCGELFELSFDLPFKDFLPQTVPLRFWIQGESVELALYLPETFTSRSILLALNANKKILGRNSITQSNNTSRKWRNLCQKSAGWIDCWSVPIVALSINYTYHPVPPLGPPPQADITTPEKEERLLSPMRIPRCRKSPGIQWPQDGKKFDPCTLEPDKVSLDLEIGPSVLFLYGSWLRNFMHLKENIFGEDQSFTDMHQSRASSVSSGTADANIMTGCSVADPSGAHTDSIKQKEFDPRQYRPLEVALSVTMHDIQAHLVKNCSDNDPPCPIILVERFGFEMKKGFKETQLQLLLSPSILIVSDNANRQVRETHVAQGHLLLSSLQVRGHATFSDEGRTLDEETLEYAWMVEVQLGKLSGKLTAPQLYQLVTSLETFLLLVKDTENHLRPSRSSPRFCHHGLPPLLCPESDSEVHYRCPSSDEIKYRMVRLAIYAVDLYLIETSTAFHIWASPIRVATCNFHGNQVKSVVTAVLPSVQVRQFISTGGNFNHSNTNTTGSGRSQSKGNRDTVMDSMTSELRLEVGSLTFGPLIIEAAISLPIPDHDLHLVQHKYLEVHDEVSKRLWFLWPKDSATTKFVGKCGCIGGCAFFGNNRNGANFFNPSRQDLQDAVKKAAFRIREPGHDPGFGQSILHESQLVFHMPPYGSQDISLQEPANNWDIKGGTLKEGIIINSSDTHSVSSTSFISAVSSQEDMTLVNLHMQVNKPIVDSPLLMSSYVSHLSQVSCNNWSDKTLPNFTKHSTAERVGGIPLSATSVYEEHTSTQIQGTLIFPKVNITLLQASVVEEIISFSALDNLRDLTCVSLFAVCFDGITARFQSSKEAKEIVQTFQKPPVLPSGQKKPNMMSKVNKSIFPGQQTAGPTLDNQGGELVYIETSETQQEELIVTLNIGKIHTQLRQLKNESSILKDAIITAIPSQQSHVLFTCARISSPLRTADFYSQQHDEQPLTSEGSRHNIASNAVSDDLCSSSEDKLGFIMFECGFEGVSLKIVKQAFFEKGENGKEPAAAAGEADTVGTDTVRSKDEVESTDKQPTPVLYIVSETVTSVGSSSVKPTKGVTVLEVNPLMSETKDEPNNSSTTVTTSTTGTATTSAAAGSSSTNTTSNTDSTPATAVTNTNTSNINGNNEPVHETKGNTSSCVIEFKTVWFNFAAPPRAPITRKIDFTRLDWNLLSTASPAINAWMNPSNRFAIRVVHTVRSMYRRSTGIVASLMAEALDVQGIHMPIKSRYCRFTPLAKTLQEDPSCQLCSVLQKFVLQTDIVTIEGNIRETELPNLSTLRQESRINTMTTEDTLEDTDYQFLAAAGYNLYPMHDSLRLLDAHLIFEPLLSSLGVMPQQMISNLNRAGGNNSSFDTLGSNLSLVGNIDTMRIDIVVSEYGKVPDKKKGKGTAPKTCKNPNSTKFYLDLPPETPAFLCEKIGIELDMKKMADMTVDDLIQKQNVLYISRGQLKKHTSNILNISLNVRYISQQVNMPLLRLLHQISNMYQNVKETQMELKEEQNPVETKCDNTTNVHKNNDSSSTSDMHEQASVINEKMKTQTDPQFPRSLSQHKVFSPSSSLRSRPQSFAQKLRSTSKSVKGYMNLNEGVSTPMFAVSPSGSGLEHITIASDKSKEGISAIPRCWKTVYYLLDLYATMPETKTITHRFSVLADVSDSYKGNRKYDVLTESKCTADIEKGVTNGAPVQKAARSTPVPQDKVRELNLVTGERTRLVVFGVARIHRTRLLATLSGLKLEAEITSLQSSLTCHKKSRPASLEYSLMGQVGRTMIVLLEGVALNQQTVVKVTVGKSQALYSSISRRLKDKNSGLLTVGPVNIDIPQHPVALHGMMTRGSKQLSSTLQELRVTRTSSRISRTAGLDDVDYVSQHSPRHLNTKWQSGGHQQNNYKSNTESSLLQPLVMQFTVVLQSLSIAAALLPSHQAQYKMDQVNSSGVTGSKAKFTIDLPHHSLSFTTKLQVTEANLPSEASIELPKVHVSAEYIQDGNNKREAQFADGVVLWQGIYLSAVADIGVFEHSLTTDLLNHLVFVQKVFKKVFEKVPFGQLTSPLTAPHLGTLFLQLTVDDMGICLPLNPLPLTSWGMNRTLYDADSRGAVVVTLESTSISACSSGSLVSKSRFVGLCLHFAEDFETSLDDWKPDMTDSSIMNLCVVSEGTYEVCSRTIAQKQGGENAKWLLNVQWQMEGVDIHLDVNVGKQLSSLGHTLTMLTGSQEEGEVNVASYDSDETDQVDGNTASLESITMKRTRTLTDSLPAFVFDPSLDAKKRSKLIEKEMNEQAKIINDLRSLGASHGTIEQEMKRLQELEAMVFKDFRRDMIQKLQRQSVKASSIKGKFGLGSKASTYRSRSFIVPSPTPEHNVEMERWLTKDFKSEGRLSIGSNGHKNMYIGIGLGGSSLDAKGGILGGTIELSKIVTYIHIREDPGTEPDHTVGLKLFALELRLDYMGTGVLMCRVSSLAVSLRDEWKINRSNKKSEAFIPTRRPAMIFMHGDLGWDQLQLMISKSTTADLLKMFYKLEEFFSQQFKSSKRVFSSLQPRAARASSFKRKYRQSAGANKRKAPTAEGLQWEDARHHRHWQRVLGQVAGLHLSTLSFPLPPSGTVLRGTMELHGSNISLACFHGINFKSKSWALFSLKEPCISFATEEGDHQCLDVHVVQTLTFSLGMTTEQPHAQHHSMATVCRISRNVLFPPQFRTLQEWFHYAFASSEIDAVDRFPSLEKERIEGTEQQRARSSSSNKLQDPNHTREVIFALPSMQLHLKTEHLQSARTPDIGGHKPMVECSFITEFEDHIFVTVDADAFFFLHDVITSYVKEKERVSGLRAHSPDHDRKGNAPTTEEERKRKAFDPAEMFTKDWRNYHCKTWHLEPTVRLLSWAGKSIEPYGVDYILQKLGFSHARTTIPKWMQRGFMDPLDKVLAVLMLRMVTIVRGGEPGGSDEPQRRRITEK